MDQQASALSQMAEATLNNSKALERIAEASHKQVIINKLPCKIIFNKLKLNYMLIIYLE